MLVTRIDKNFNSKTLSFKGPAELITGGLHFLNSNPTIGAVAVDMSSMALPRTIVDSTRGVDAGIETGLREITCSVNLALLGAWGLLGSLLFSKSIENKYLNANSGKIHANAEAIDVLGHAYKYSPADMEMSMRVGKLLAAAPATNADKKVMNYVCKVVENLEGMNGEAWTKLNHSKDEAAKILYTTIVSTQNPKALAQAKKTVYKLFTAETGANQVCKLAFNKNEITASLDSILYNVISLGKSFYKVGEKALQNGFIKDLKSMRTRTAILGVGIPTVFGMLNQPINAWLTKIRTGKDGFVGVKEGKKDTSSGFKLLKVGVGAVAGALMLRTIASFKEIPAKLQFSSSLGSIAQFKFAYGLTVVSRLFSARDKKELRESLTKDSLGFLNWLILGGFVSKLLARTMGGKELINYISKEEKTNRVMQKWNWITNATVKSSEEILLKDLKDFNMKALKKIPIRTAQGEFIPFKTLLKSLPESMKATKIKIRKVNISQLAGYLYSGIVLGVLIPKLNIYISGRKDKKAQNQSASPETAKQVISPKMSTMTKFNPYFIGTAKK